MNARLVLLCGLLLPACVAPHELSSPAVVIRTAVDSARLACQIYSVDMNIPRDAAVTEFCRLKCEAKP